MSAPSAESDEDLSSQIDRMRRSAGSATIPLECGNIVAVKGIGDRLFLLSERCIVSGVFADHVDPERTNPNLPKMIQQKELEFGSEHSFICKTVGAAFELADATYLPNSVPHLDLLYSALEVAHSLAFVVSTGDELGSHQETVRQSAEAGNLSAAYVPRTPNLIGRVRQCLASLRDVEIAIKKIVNLFYPKERANESWDTKIKPALLQNYGEDDIRAWMDFAWQVLDSAANHRNAMIHRDDEKYVDICDYRLQADGVFIAPTIEIKHSKSGVVIQDLRQFLELRVFEMSEVFEAFLSYLCDLNAQLIAGQYKARVVVQNEGAAQNGSHVTWRIDLGMHNAHPIVS